MYQSWVVAHAELSGSRATGFYRSESRYQERLGHGIFHDVRIEVPISLPLLVSLVADDVVDDPLIHSRGRQTRDEAVTKHVKSFDHIPL